MKSLMLFSFVVFSSLFAEEQATVQTQTTLAEKADISCICESFGHIIGKYLKYSNVPFDTTQMIKGMQDAFLGKQSPMSEIEFVQAIAPVQEKYFTEQCKKNLEQAESFLADNAKKKGVISLEKGKVQYLIIEQGNGAIVQPHFSPSIRYTMKTLDGFIYFSDAPSEELVCLDETIPGLKAGLVGMREGEKRTIHIHPDLAYGMRECYRSNSLYIFEVEVLKADTTSNLGCQKSA